MTSSAASSLVSFTGSLVLAGAGKMGGALLTGWLAGGLKPAQVTVIEPFPAEETRALAARGLHLNPSAAPKPADVLVLAVKPQTFVEAAPALSPFVASSTLVLSIMAGRTLGSIAQACGGAVVRTMPNTPAAIGRGMTVAVAAPHVSPAQRTLAASLLTATGNIAWVDDEALMDAVTAVSGSGPAYVFLLVEELARAGVAAGLPEALAMTLAPETVTGSGELLHRSPLDAATLRQHVTSPGGTTAAALAVLMGENGLRTLMQRAVAEATRRSRELAS